MVITKNYRESNEYVLSLSLIQICPSTLIRASVSSQFKQQIGKNRLPKPQLIKFIHIIRDEHSFTFRN